MTNRQALQKIIHSSTVAQCVEDGIDENMIHRLQTEGLVIIKMGIRKLNMRVCLTSKGVNLKYHGK